MQHYFIYHHPPCPEIKCEDATHPHHTTITLWNFCTWSVYEGLKVWSCVTRPSSENGNLWRDLWCIWWDKLRYSLNIRRSGMWSDRVTSCTNEMHLARDIERDCQRRLSYTTNPCPWYFWGFFGYFQSNSHYSVGAKWALNRNQFLVVNSCTIVCNAAQIGALKMGVDCMEHTGTKIVSYKRYLSKLLKISFVSCKWYNCLH